MMSRKYVFRAVSGMAALTIGLTLGITQAAPQVLVIAFTVMGTILFAGAVFATRKQQLGFAKDERTRKIEAYSSAYSWFFTYVVLLLLIWNELLEWIKLSVLQALGILSVTMIVSMAGTRQFFLHQGDIE